MAAEYYIRFSNKKWYNQNKHTVQDHIMQLSTFSSKKNEEFWIKGLEGKNQIDSWDYDVRLFTDKDEYIFMEISSHPPSIEADLKLLLSWIKKQSEISVLDEDGEMSNW